VQSDGLGEEDGDKPVRMVNWIRPPINFDKDSYQIGQLSVRPRIKFDYASYQIDHVQRDGRCEEDGDKPTQDGKFD